MKQRRRRMFRMWLARSIAVFEVKDRTGGAFHIGDKFTISGVTKRISTDKALRKRGINAAN